MYWILDFDDTLALGPNTWALETVMPDLVKKNNLPFDETKYKTVMLTAQEKANLDDDEEAVVNYVFESLGWDIKLKDELITRTYNDYIPEVFEDTLPFLDACIAQSDTLLCVSNNNHAPYLIEQLGLAKYFTAVFTPKTTQKRRKPYHDMWQDIHALIGENAVHVIGDDPWSDGLFAEGNPQATAWILDRMGRYETLHATKPYRFIPSLAPVFQLLER